MPTPLPRLTLEGLNADIVNKVAPTFSVVDASPYGSMMGLVIYWARKAQVDSETQLALVDANIEVSRLLGELSSKLNELNGLFAKPTDAMTAISEWDQNRVTALRFDINALIVKCGYGYKLRADGTQIENPAATADKVSRLFGDAGRVGLAVDRINAQGIDIIAKSWTDYKSDWIAARVVQTATDTPENVDQLRVGFLADYMSTPPYPVAVPDTQAAGLAHLQGTTILAGATSGVSNASLFFDAFNAEYKKLFPLGNELGTSAIGMARIIKDEYALRLKQLTTYSVNHGLVPNDDGTTVNGAMILVQADSDAMSQEINKAMSAASNKIQLASGYFDAGKGSLDQQSRLGKAMINY